MADIRFEISINGEPACVAGATGFGVFTASLVWVKRDPAKYEAQKLSRSEKRTCTPEWWAEESLYATATSSDESTNGLFSWLNRDLQVGDAITIRVLGPGETNPAFARNHPRAASWPLDELQDEAS